MKEVSDLQSATAALTATEVAGTIGFQLNFARNSFNIDIYSSLLPFFHSFLHSVIQHSVSFDITILEMCFFFVFWCNAVFTYIYRDLFI